MEPDPDVVAQLADGEAEQASRVLELFNRWISEALDKEHVIGHSFFLNPSYHPFSRKSLSQIWEMDIQPLLEEYFFGDSDRLKEAKTQWDRAIVAAFAVEDDADS